ncbi:hypothetical protein ACX3O0_06755 [Homoserinimonas sp. A447]
MNISKLSLRAAAARQKFASAKARGFKATAAETGAIDLASIMVGVLVIGIVGGVIAATVFAVIPWSQDQAAQQALSAVSTSQSVGYAGSSSEGLGAYLDKAGLVNSTGTSIAADGLQARRSRTGLGPQRIRFPCQRASCLRVSCHRFWR